MGTVCAVPFTAREAMVAVVGEGRMPRWGVSSPDFATEGEQGGSRGRDKEAAAPEEEKYQV